MRRSISATCNWDPGYSCSPLSAISLPCSQLQPLDASITPKLDELEGEVTPIEMSFDEEQNCNSSNKTSAGFEVYEGPAGEPFTAEEQNVNSVLKNDCVNDQWWMKSKVHPPPKRRSASAKRRYPPGCGRNPEFAVNNFDSKGVYCEEDDIKVAVVGNYVNAISDGVDGTNKKRNEICEVGVMDSMDGAVFRHSMNKYAKNDRFKDETFSLESHTELVRDSEDRDVNSVMVKGVVKTALEDIAKERDAERHNGNEKFSCAKRDRVSGKDVSVDSNSTLGNTQNKMKKRIKLKIVYKGKTEEACNAAVPSSRSPIERGKERSSSNNPLSIKRTPMKVISKQQVRSTHPLSHYKPSPSCVDRSELDSNLEEGASHAILESQSFLYRIPAEKSVSAKNRRKQSSSSGNNVDQHQIRYFGPNKAASKPTNPRARVKRCLRLFQKIFRNKLQEVESGKKLAGSERNRIDLWTASFMRENKETLNRGKLIVGTVPGVEVGDEFRYRAKLSILGLHRPPQAGIDYRDWNGKSIAISIVASGGYSDEVESEGVLIYTGAGGKPTGKPGHTEAHDQKLERGNLALKNSIDLKTPVRVIHGWDTKEAGKVVMNFTYDGLYKVEEYWRDKETYTVKGKEMSAIVFRFRLRRLEGQPPRNWCKLKRVQKTDRKGLCSKDISLGKKKRCQYVL